MPIKKAGRCLKTTENPVRPATTGFPPHARFLYDRQQTQVQKDKEMILLLTPLFKDENEVLTRVE
jgi:hypothetical protein